MDFQAFLSFDVCSCWFLPLAQELPFFESPAGCRNPILQVQLIFHEQQLNCGGLLFLLSPLDDAVIEDSSTHPDGLAADTAIIDLL